MTPRLSKGRCGSQAPSRIVALPQCRSQGLFGSLVPRPVSDTLKALQVLAEFLKFLVSVADILEALQLRTKILNFLTFVTDFLGTSV